MTRHGSAMTAERLSLRRLFRPNPIVRMGRTIMLRRLGTASFALAALAALLAAAPAHAQFARELPPRIGIGIGIGQQGAEGNMVALTGNVRPEARAEYDRGAVVDYFRMEHMLLQMRRPVQQERALEQFIGELHTKGSANFHKWTNARKFGERFGPPTRELEAVTRWLEMQGFKVNVIYPS
jgi:Pro-kumamolisin, activation domain